MTEREASAWSAVKARGRQRYILMTGILGWGLLMAFGVTLVTELFTDPPGPLWGRLALALAIYPFGGFWFGQRMWSDNERRYVEWRGRWKSDSASDG